MCYSSAGDVDVPVTVCQAAMYAHNKLRVNHGQAAMTFDDELATTAEQWAMRTANNIHLNPPVFALENVESGSLGMATLEFNWQYADFHYTFADIAYAL